METTIQAQISIEELLTELRDVIRDIFDDEIRSMIREKANEIIEMEMAKITEPLIVSFLKSEKFDEHYGWDGDYEKKSSVEEMVNRKVVNYLDERTYVYDSKSDVLSQRLHTSYNSSSRDKTRLEHYLLFSIERFVNEHLVEKMEQLTKDYLSDKNTIEESTKQQLGKMLKEKFRL